MLWQFGHGRESVSKQSKVKCSLMSRLRVCWRRFRCVFSERLNPQSLPAPSSKLVWYINISFSASIYHQAFRRTPAKCGCLLCGNFRELYEVISMPSFGDYHKRERGKRLIATTAAIGK